MTPYHVWPLPCGNAEMDDIAISVDVEWAHPEILADVVELLDERGLHATFFCTHEGIDVPGHERALHPNFRRSRNPSALEVPPDATDRDFYAGILSRCHSFCPEAIGVRAHSLISDSELLHVYGYAGLQYDSSYMLPLARGLEPAWRGDGILELPIYYMDHWDLREQATQFNLGALDMAAPGLKVFDFHPNLIFMNAAVESDYLEMRPHFHDPDWLRNNRRAGRGARSMFIDLLDSVNPQRASFTLADVNARWRAQRALNVKVAG